MVNLINLIMTILLVPILFSQYFLWRAISILKQADKDLWESIGRPNFLNNSLPTSYKLHRFIWKKQYISLGDPSLSKYCNILRGFQIFYLILLPSLFPLYIVAVMKLTEL